MPDPLQFQIAQLNSENATAVAAAAEALCQMGRAAQPAAVSLVRASGTDDETALAWVAAALEELGPPPESEIEELVALADDHSTEISFWAITLLGRAGEAASRAVPTLAKQLRHSPKLAVRERAAWALGKIGPAAAMAAPQLHEAAAGGQPRLSRLAKSALAAIAG